MIYLDNNATTRALDEVIEEMNIYSKIKYANPESLYSFAQNIENEIFDVKKNIMKKLKTSEKKSKIIFTNGATEAINMAILGYVLKNKPEDTKPIITSKLEHPAVFNTFKYLEKLGYKTKYIKNDKFGFIDLKDLEEQTKEGCFFASFIHANNEIGTIQKIKEISKLIHKVGGKIHIDSCQAFIKENINFNDYDLLTISGHKIHGPKGIGALIIKNEIKLKPIYFGGDQEYKLRPGTHNTSAIMGFNKAIEIGFKNKIKNKNYVKKLRDNLANGLLEIEDTVINGPWGKIKNKRIYNNLNIRFFGVEGEAIVLGLDSHKICISTRSACSSKTLTPSRILNSIGLTHEQIHGSIRLSPSIFNTQKEIDYVINKTKKVIKKLRNLSSAYG